MFKVFISPNLERRSVFNYIEILSEVASEMKKQDEAFDTMKKREGFYKEVIVGPGFFDTRAWKIQNLFLCSLDEPKTFPELCDLVKKELGIRNPDSSAFYALREMISRGEVVGVIDEESLKKTAGKKLSPIFKLTGNRVIFREQPIDGSGDMFMKLLMSEQGNIAAKQFYIKRKRKTSSYIFRPHGYADRRTGPVFLYIPNQLRGHGGREWVPLRGIRDTDDLERRLRQLYLLLSHVFHELVRKGYSVSQINAELIELIKSSVAEDTKTHPKWLSDQWLDRVLFETLFYGFQSKPQSGRSSLSRPS